MFTMLIMLMFLSSLLISLLQTKRAREAGAAVYVIGVAAYVQGDVRGLHFSCVCMV